MYLLGSVHVAKAGLYPLSDPIESAFERSDTLVLEVHLDQQGRLAAAARMAAAASYPAGDGLEHHISLPLLAQLDQRVRAGPVAVAALQRFRPWFVAMTVSMLELQKLGFKPEQGIDSHFQRRAEGKKRILSIETVEDQLAVFAGLSDRVQALMLKEALDEAEHLGAVMDAVMVAWQQGNAQAVDSLLMESMRRPEYQPLFQQLFVARNLRMADAVAEYLQTESTYFVVVGAGHLVGQSGVVSLLQRRGHSVVRQ